MARNVIADSLAPLANRPRRNLRRIGVLVIGLGDLVLDVMEQPHNLPLAYRINPLG
jgi:uncharacterized protein YjeT (DUF2065 family)